MTFHDALCHNAFNALRHSISFIYSQCHFIKTEHNMSGDILPPVHLGDKSTMSENTQNKETVVIEEETINETANLFFESARKAMSAGLGAIDIAREEVTTLLEKTQVDVEEIFNNLVERGESFGATNREKFDDAVNTTKNQAEETVTGIRESFESQVEKVLTNLNIPTKADIDGLNKKIATLTKKVNAMAKEAKATKAKK